MTFHGNWEQSGGGEARTEFYRTWRTKMGLCCVGDTDQIEYRYKDGELTIVAVIELGVAQYGPNPGMLSADHANSFVSRLSAERPQGEMLRLVAAKLGVPLFGVLMLQDQVEVFHWWDLTSGEYRRMFQREYVLWLHCLGGEGYEKTERA